MTLLERLRGKRRKPRIIGGSAHMIAVSILRGPGYTAFCQTCGWSGPSRREYLTACGDRELHYAETYAPEYEAEPPNA